MTAKPWPDAQHPFFVYDNDQGEMTCYSTAEERDAGHAEAIANYLDDTWSDGVENIMSGVVTHTTEQTNLQTKPADGTPEAREWNFHGDTICDYVATALQSVMKDEILSDMLEYSKGPVGASEKWGERTVGSCIAAFGWHQALKGQVLQSATPEAEWITKLRRELLMSKMTHNFTLSRDEVIELLGGQFMAFDGVKP